MKPATCNRVLTLLLLLFTLLATLYSIVVPPFEASDELWHYPMVKYIADHWALPVQEPGVETPWRQEGSQPPLYYFVGALATAWIDTSDMPQVRHVNPHADNGVATADGNVNLIVHDPRLEAWPWRGTVLALHVVRLLSVLMAAGSVYLTYRIVRELFPTRPLLALGATAVHAFTPMFVFIAGSVNNDNLTVLLSNLGLWLLLRLLRPNARGTAREYLALGVVLGLAALTKFSSLALTVLTALVVTRRALGRPRAVDGWREFLRGGLLTLLPLLAIAGWWAWRNLQLYGDPSGLNAFIAVLGQRDVPADLAQLWRERFSFMAGYWGNFGGLNVLMPAWTYSTLNALAVLAGLGLPLALLRRLLRTRPVRPCSLRAAAAHVASSDWSLPIFLLWGLGVLLPWIPWARVTWSSQGRLIFAALPVWSLLLALGLGAWLPRRWRDLPGLVLALFLLGLAALAPWLWIRPAYATPTPLTEAELTALPGRLEAEGYAEINAEFGGVMRLLGYEIGLEQTEPGGVVPVTLYWQALAPADRDYTVFVHLLGVGDLLVGQRDTFPGLGTLSTTWLTPGAVWADRYVVPVGRTSFAPDELQVEVGLCDPASLGCGARLPVTGAGGEPLGDHVRFGRVALDGLPGELPNPVELNFGDRLTLAGYTLDPRSVRPGEDVQVTLYWRARQPLDANYTVSVQIVDEAQVKAAQSDAWPAGSGTAVWTPGDLVPVEDGRTLTVGPDAAPGVYGLRVSVYLYDDAAGTFDVLPLLPGGGRMPTDHVVLTRVRVE